MLVVLHNFLQGLFNFARTYLLFALHASMNDLVDLGGIGFSGVFYCC